MLFRKKKAVEPKDFDRENLEPALRTSICTGEAVAGFQDRRTGHFTEDRLIQTDRDLEEFLRDYGIKTVKHIY